MSSFEVLVRRIDAVIKRPTSTSQPSQSCIRVSTLRRLRENMLRGSQPWRTISVRGS